MADLKISELSALAGSNLVAADELAIVDDSASETKKITVSDLIANGVTVISDDTIPGAKILFAAGDIATAALADSAVTTAKVNNGAITAAKLANESTVDLVTTLPTSGVFTGQLAVDTDDNSLYCWNGSAWLSLKAPNSVGTISGSTTGEINIVTAVSGTTVTISATLDNTTSAAQFLAGPTGSAGVVGYRTVVGSDLPTATTSAKGGVVVNGNGLIMDGDTIEINNAVTSSGTHHVVTYDTNGLITGGRTLTSSDLPIATSSARGAVIPGDGLTVDVSGNLSVNNTVAADTYTKVTVTAQGLVSSGTTLLASDIPDLSAAKLTSGTIGSSLIGSNAVTGAKLADQSTTKFGGALGSDNVTIFPSGDYKGQFFYDETTADLYIFTGSAYVPITLLTGNLVNAGVYNANTNLLSTVTTAGSSAGFTVGAALPAPAGINLNHYVVVSVSGTGTGVAPAVALAPPDMLLSQGVGAEYSLIDVSNAIAGQTAANISVVAAGNIAATNVQSALQELDTEKLQLAGGTMTGDLNLGTGVDVVFEGSAADSHETTLGVINPTADRALSLPNISGTLISTGDTGTVTSTMLTDGTIVNADINASAEIAVSKLANGTARQLLQTDAGGSGVEFTSNVDVPGTLDVTGAVTLDSTLATTGLISANGKISFPLGTAAAPSIYFGSDTNTGVFSPAGDQVAITTAGTQRVVVDASGNVGIGTSSPIRALQVGSYGTGNGEIALGASTTGNCNIFMGDGATGVDYYRGYIQYKNSADAMCFATSNNERMRIDSSGNVFIGGTTAASADIALNANGNATFVGNITAARADIGDSTSGYPGTPLFVYSTSNASNQGTIQAKNFGSGGANFIGFNSSGNSTATLFADGSSSFSGDLSLKRNGTQNVLISNDGSSTFNGAISLGAVAIPSAGTSRIYSRNTDNKLYLQSQGSGISLLDGSQNTMALFESTAIRLLTSNAERMRIDSSGRLLLGTSSSRGGFFAGTSGFDPLFQIEQPGYSVASIIRNSNNTASPAIVLGKSRGAANGATTIVSSGDSIGEIVFQAADGAKLVPAASIYGQVDGTPGTNDMPGRLVFSTTADGASSPTERMRIDSTGMVRTFSSTANGALNVCTSQGASTSANLILGQHSATNTTSGTLSFLVLSNGDVKNTSNSYGGISDQKLKENIVDAKSQWSDLKALQVRNYNFIEGQTHTQIGVVAQEVETVSPGLVSESPDRDKDGSDLGTTTKSVNYSVLYMKAVKALQEAMERIETLEAKVAALEAG